MKPKILIIEDDYQSLYMLTFLLESGGYEVIQSNNGADGIAMAKDHNPNAIILDIQLPGMDGYEIAKVLRKNSELKNILIVVVTSFAMMGDKTKALEAGGSGYIEKPIDPDTFISLMESFISAQNGVTEKN